MSKAERFLLPKIRSLSRAEVRSIDVRAADAFAMPTLILMENAGRGAADWIAERLASQADTNAPRVLIVCGSGNNGGDGCVVARHLDLRMIPVKVIGLNDPSTLKGDTAIQWTILEKSGMNPRVLSNLDELSEALEKADWVVDALLGTGLTRTVEGRLFDAIDRINRAGKPVISLDIPSGLDADLGEPLGIAIKAQATLTFVAKKIGFDRPAAAEYLGEVVEIGIGAPRRVLEPFQLDDDSKD